jgi:predicted ester cyclase
MSGPPSATCTARCRTSHSSIEAFAEHGGKIWVRVRARGTASGPFFGPPSYKPIGITVFDLARVANGQIIDHWGVPDRFALLAQTGVLDRLVH